MMAGSEGYLQIRRSDAGRSQLPVHLLLIFSLLLSSAYYVFTRVVLVNGMNLLVLSLYRDILAMLVLMPVAYFIDKGNRLRISWYVVSQLALLGLTGIYGSNFLLFVGISHTSAEVSASMQLVVPVLTTLIALLCGIETIHWHRLDGKAKVLGIIASFSGAILIGLYKGPALISIEKDVGHGWAPWSLSSFLEDINLGDITTLRLKGWHISSWHFGVFCLICNTMCMATFINVQACLLKRHAAPVSILTFSYGFGAIFMGITAFFAVTDQEDWILGFDQNLAVVVYNGVIASALNFGILGWCLARGGPLLLASYLPVQPIVSALLSLAFVGTTLFLGSILGTVLVIAGLLLVSWAQSQTIHLSLLGRQIDSESDLFKSAVEEALQEPLLQVAH